MKLSLSLPVFAAVLAMSAAHICLLNPLQRGSLMDINKPGSNDCVLLDAPCGGRMSERASTTWMAGQNVTVVLQKNLDHWDMATPGHFAVNIMQGTMMKEIARVPDTADKSLSIYQITGMVPMGMTGRAVLQAVYVTMNPQAPAMFYQCADIEIR